MLYALVALDKPGSLDLRMSTRPDHLAFLEGLKSEGALILAGPFLDDAGKPCGSLVVVKADTQEAAQAMLEADPYQKVGLFASTDLRPWNWTFGRPEGV